MTSNSSTILTTPRVTLSTPILLSQSPLPAAPASTKIPISFLSLAICDALGSPGEFLPRGGYPRITSYKRNENFRTPPGTFTDDTSMSLCLAEALVAQRTAFMNSRPSDYPSPEDMAAENLTFALRQACLYLRWFHNGYFSPVGYCFDIGGAIRQALGIWDSEIRNGRSGRTLDPNIPRRALREVNTRLNKPTFRGNGTLMRILPVPLAFWREGEEAERQASWASAVTHPDGMCKEACSLYTRLVVRILQEGEKAAHNGRPSAYTKLDLLKELSSYTFVYPSLRDRLALPAASENYSAHPLLTTEFTPQNVRSSGYVLHTLHAALYVFFNTRTFVEGAILCANLGEDTDTVAAVWGGLAGAWYGCDSFWEDNKTREWKEGLRKRKWVENLASALVEMNGRGWRGEPGRSSSSHNH